MTAEFYDLLQASEYRVTAERLLDRLLGTPRVGILDIGAGTGIATALLARRSDVTVHAIEPAVAMRTVLLSRLAGHADLLDRVRVHPRPIERLGLHRAADFAICLNMMAGLDPIGRTEALHAIAAALVPGATLVVQAPPTQPGPAHSVLPDWCLGGDTYGGDVACTTDGTDRLLWRFTYRVSRDGIIVREETEAFPGYIAARDVFAAELRDAGFTPIDADEPAIVIARRVEALRTKSSAGTETGALGRRS